MNKITIRVPATTANLGPGYDCLGVALQLYNRVTVARAKVAVDQPMMGAVGEKFFATSKTEPFPFTCTVAGEVPRSRGLGSSVTVRLGLLHGLNALCGRPLDPQRIFHLCAELEGHPDNAAPGAFGGFTVAGGAEVARFEVAPELRFVLLIPDFEISTPAARRVLPEQLDRLQAAKSCANACRITAAFASRNYELLRGAFTDFLHQPYREKELIPFLSRVISAGEAAGAFGGFLSGSGSTICCVTIENAAQVSSAMIEATGLPGMRSIIASADNKGVRVHR
jgi:homoserine kinase